MLQGDKMLTKTKEKWEVKATGFKIKPHPESPVAQAAIIGRSLLGKHSRDASSAQQQRSKDSVRKRVSDEWTNVKMG